MICVGCKTEAPTGLCLACEIEAARYFQRRPAATQSAEIQRLKWRLNHQTDDDAAACAAGKHGDCGK